MQPDNQNQFDFIMDPGQKSNSGQSFIQSGKNKIIVSILFVSFVLIAVIVLFNIFTSLGKQGNDDIISVVAWQTEIVRISEIGLKEAKDPNTRTQLSTLQAFMQTDISETTAYLSKNGTKLKPEQLASALDATVEKELETAAQLNRYDEVLLEIIDEKTGKYKAALQQALNATSPKTNRESVLNKNATNIITYEGVVAVTQ